MTSSASTATTSIKHEFARLVDEVRLPKSDINELILDYLTVAGYPNAAARFSAEANLRPQQDNPCIVARQQIQRSIQQGDIETAIDALNELDPEILDKDPPLHFALLRLQLVEIIRTCRRESDGDVSPALEFATEKLGPRAPTNPQFLEDLEKTMTLLVFSHNPKTLDPSLAALLKPDLRREVADKVNKAIVGRQMHRRDAAIRHLVQMRAWAENTVRKDGKYDLPSCIDLGLNGEEVDKNGQDVVMT